MYFTKPFGLVSGVDGTLLMAPHSSIRLTEEKMVRFLDDLGGEKTNRLGKDALTRLLEEAGIPADKGLVFLETTGILEIVPEEIEEQAPFDQALLVCDQPTITTVLAQALQADGVAVSGIYTPSEMPSDHPPERTLFIFFLEEYDSAFIREHYRKYSALQGVGFIQAYYLRHEFKVDGLFLPSMGSPCHFCHYERWSNREERSFGDNSKSWHQVVELLNRYDKKIPPCIPLSDCDRLYSAQILRRRIQQIMGIPTNRVHLDSYASSISANLVMCNTSSEPIPHWHSCDCSKAKF